MYSFIPKINEPYWTVKSYYYSYGEYTNACFIREVFWGNYHIDWVRLRSNNVFKTQEEAKARQPFFEDKMLVKGTLNG